MFIRSERLFLRPGWSEDWSELLALVAGRSHGPRLTADCVPYTEDDARRFLQATGKALLPRFLITLPGEGGAPIIGCIGLSHHRGEAELGYWIARELWGNGYGAEAARAVVSLARTLGHARVVASHFLENPGAAQVLHEAGFARTGRIAERRCLASGVLCSALEYAVSLVAGGPQGSGGCDDDALGGGRRRAA